VAHAGWAREDIHAVASSIIRHHYIIGFEFFFLSQLVLLALHTAKANQDTLSRVLHAIIPARHHELGAYLTLENLHAYLHYLVIQVCVLYHPYMCYTETYIET
jgi:hypothetical protein